MLNEGMKSFIALALKEDLGRGDVTSESSVPADLHQKDIFLRKEQVWSQVLRLQRGVLPNGSVNQVYC